MNALWRGIFAPLLSITILVVGTGFFTSFVSVILYNNGLSETVIGSVHACFFAGLIAGCLYLEKLILRIGHIRAFATFATLTAATILAQGLYFDPLIWAALRFIAGICLAGMYIVIESWLLDKSTVFTRGRVLAVYLVAYYGAQAFGQFFFDWIDITSEKPFIFSAFIATLSLLPVLMTSYNAPKFEAVPQESASSLFEKSPFGLIGSLFSGIILGAIFAFIPNVAQELNLRVSYFMGLTIFGGMLFQWPIGKLSDRMDRRKLLAALSLSVLLPTSLLYFFDSSKLLAYTSVFALGGLTFTIYPLAVALVCDKVDQKAMTHIAGVLLLAYSIGTTIGPLVSSTMMTLIGFAGLYVFIALNGLFLGVFGLLTSENTEVSIPTEND